MARPVLNATVVDGLLSAKLDNDNDGGYGATTTTTTQQDSSSSRRWVDYPAGTSFVIPANSGFDVKAVVDTAYYCEYLE